MKLSDDLLPVDLLDIMMLVGRFCFLTWPVSKLLLLFEILLLEIAPKI